MRWWTPAIVLALLASTAPAGGAKPDLIRVDLALEATGSANLDGDFTGMLGLQSATVLGTRNDAAALRAEMDAARVKLIRQPYAGLRGNVTPIGPDVQAGDSGLLGEEVLDDFLFSGTLRTTSRSESVLEVFAAAKDASYTVSVEDLDLGQLEGAGDRYRHDFTPLAPRDYRSNSELPTLSPGADLVIRDATTILTYGATLALQDADGSTRTLETGRVPKGHAGVPWPGQDLNATAYDDIYAIVYLHQGTTKLSGDWRLHVESIEGLFQGTLGIAGIQASTGKPVLDSPTLLEAEGKFSTKSAHDGSSSTWTLRGEASRIGLDGSTVAKSKDGAAVVLVAVGGATGLLVLAYALKRGILQVFVSAYARADPLGSKTRLRMLILVVNQPGITTKRLCLHLGVQATTAKYHARVLAEAKLLRVHRTGKIWHYEAAPAARKALGMAPNAPSVGVAACLQNPVRRRIHECLQSRSVSLKELVACVEVGGEKTTASRLSWHLRRMEEAGVIQKSGSNANTRYALQASTQQSAAGEDAPDWLSPGVSRRLEFHLENLAKEGAIVKVSTGYRLREENTWLTT